MKTIILKITGEGVEKEDFHDFLGNYLTSLGRNNQILNEDWIFEPIPNGARMVLVCPEADSLDRKNCNEYAISWRNRIEGELGCTLEYSPAEDQPGFSKMHIPTDWQSFVLKKLHYSPLIETKSMEPVPLYKIPFTCGGNCHEGINFWENNYGRVEGLWFGDKVGERWSQNQLQDHKSELNQWGMECCRMIEAVTQVPTYYFLFNYRAISRQKDQARPCPNCGGNWFVGGENINELYAFKCDNCRLVSELTLRS
ncbi:MAG: DUF2310 family Zn-ribbon-containing protein [Bacteroidia bacterium]|nr:DUF2310 family Zn-ribbon-containing protein [Bacteroidia bacterium]